MSTNPQHSGVSSPIEHNTAMPESAASQVGRMREIVEVILGYVFDDFAEGCTNRTYSSWKKETDRTILTCALVDSLWNGEATRYIWQEVGSENFHSRFPRVRVLMEQERLQHLANNVRTLTVGREVVPRRKNNTKGGRPSTPRRLRLSPLEWLNRDGHVYSVPSP